MRRERQTYSLAHRARRWQLAPSLMRGLMGYWPLWEASGTRHDLSGRGHSLTDVNTVTQHAGPFGRPCADFTRANSEVLSMSSHADVQGGGSTTPLTVACFAAIKSKTASQLCPLISKWEGGASLYEYHLRYTNYSGEDRFEFNASPDGSIPAIVIAASSFGSPTLNAWYCVMGWFDPAGAIHVQVNGVEDSAACSGVLTGTGSFKIGSISGFFGDQRIVHALVWKRLLTKQERTQLWRGGLMRLNPL